MTAPHEIPLPGPAADPAATLAAHLPDIDTDRLRAPTLTALALSADILTGPSGPHPGGRFTRDQAVVAFAACVGTWLLRGHGPWTVITRDGAAPGFIRIGFAPGDPEPELGVLFAPHAKGRGHAFEAGQAHAATQGLRRLVRCIDPENRRSRRLAARLAARLGARLASRLGARAGDAIVDGSTVWVHNLQGHAA